mgnify:CR=1 FL=1
MSNNLSDKTYTTRPTLVETDNNKWVLSEPVTTKQMYQIMLTLLKQE